MQSLLALDLARELVRKYALNISVNDWTLLGDMIAQALTEYGAACAQREREECAAMLENKVSRVRRDLKGSLDDLGVWAQTLEAYEAAACSIRSRANPASEGGEG